MPRSTSGIAVSIESELVTLPSSPSLRSTLYRGSSLSKTSSCAFPELGRASASALAPAAAVLELVPVLVFASAACCSRVRRSFIFSSMYAILRGVSLSFSFVCRIKGEQVHVLVDIERIGLLRKVVRAYRTTHFRCFVFWLATTWLRESINQGGGGCILGVRVVRHLCARP